MKPTLLILAAGMGSRYGGLKQMDQVGPSGEAIIDYSIFDAIRAGFGKVVFVIRRDIEREFNELFIEKLEPRIEVDYVFQEIDMVPPGMTIPASRKKPWGTGHAILVAREKIKEPFAVINADDFYGVQSHKVMAGYLMSHASDKEYAMVGYRLDRTLSDHGQVARGVCEASGEGYLHGIIERTNIEKTPEGIRFLDESNQPVFLNGSKTVSMNFWGFPPSVFEHLDKHFTEFLAESGKDKKKEFFIPIMIMKLIQENGVKVRILESGESWFGVTYREDKPLVTEKIREKIRMGEYPSNLWG